MVFDAYARYYDLLYRDKDYAAESEYVASYIRTQARSAKRILELGCCGTGAHAAHLARIGFTVHSVDLSDVMLARAEARKATLPAKEAERLTFASVDVRTVQTGATYDAVISLFHVMCYQTTNADLEAAFVTAALHLALAASIGPGDEVIIPVFTFVATANAVTYTGAVPVLADIDADTLCLDPERVRQAVIPRTKAIIPVHIFGHPADMHAIEEIGREHGLLVIEDAAEAHGTEIGKPELAHLDCALHLAFMEIRSLPAEKEG